jgi:NAD(P)-dependent dehydrogenase (short-subunit alcohol dehydrogenase family)
VSDRWAIADLPDLAGKAALVTGANSGLGLSIASALAGAGARVFMACRNPTKAAAAEASIRTAHPAASIDVVPLDLASLDSVRRLARDLTSTESRLDLLINNAGLMAIDRSFTEEGFEMQLGVNHLGHFVLTAELLPLLLATQGSRVVTMSSMGHRLGHMDLDDPMFERRPYRRWPAYFQSKLANLLFTFELQQRLAGAGAGTVALAAHPGGTHTDLGTEGSGITNKLMAPTMAFGQSADAGALPLLRAATAPDAIGGEFYGPRWLMRGRPVREKPSGRARRQQDWRGLWELSERLTGTSPSFTSSTPSAGETPGS